MDGKQDYHSMLCNKQPLMPNVKLSGAPFLASPLERWVELRRGVSLAVV